MLTIPLIVSAISLIIIFIINTKFSHNKSIKFFNIVFFTEAYVLSFMFEKYPLIFSLPILICSSYFLLINTKIDSNPKYSSDYSLISSSLHIMRPLGISICFMPFLYEFLVGDGIFNPSTIMVLLLGVILILYKDYHLSYQKESYFLLMFMSFNILFWIIPELIYKIYTDNLGHNVEDGWLSNDQVTQSFLAVPLVKILNLFGYYSFSSEGNISFVNLEADLLVTVSVAESCSGIYSVIIFLSCFTAYILSEKYKLSIELFTIFVIGILISYLANLFRMMTIILTGHYYDLDTMLLVHEYIGWIIFSIWIFFFWMGFSSISVYLPINKK